MNALGFFQRNIFKCTLVIYDTRSFSDLIAYALRLVIECWEFSFELFRKPGGIFPIIFGVTSVGMAVFSFPRFYKRCFWISLIPTFGAPTFYYFFSRCGMPRSLDSFFINWSFGFMIYGIGYSILYFFFYWFSVGFTYIFSKIYKLKIYHKCILIVAICFILWITAVLWKTVLLEVILLIPDIFP